MPYINVETEVYYDYDDFDREDLKEYAIRELGLTEEMNADGALDVLRELKKDSAGLSEWISIRDDLKKLIEE